MNDMSNRKLELATNLERVNERIKVAAEAVDRDPNSITLIVVTKTFPVSDIKMLYELGARNFGENRDQEGALKAPELPEDCLWHFQGQIQSNKLKSIAQWADAIHSIDEISHARKLSSLVDRRDIFIQISLSDQANRGGVEPEDLAGFMKEVSALENLDICGLMAVAPLEQEPEAAFKRLKEISQEVIKTFPGAPAISAGMSNDFEAAIAQGATHIRIGSQILGVR
jgi:pyridoxal phosphate enzyme (YggS family)